LATLLQRPLNRCRSPEPASKGASAQGEGLGEDDARRPARDRQAHRREQRSSIVDDAQGERWSRLDGKGPQRIAIERKRRGPPNQGPFLLPAPWMLPTAVEAKMKYKILKIITALRR
jgi:hypothetical protein